MPKQIAISICRDNGEILKPWTFVTLNNEWYTYDLLYRDILDGPLTPIFDLNLACKTYILKEIKASSTLAMSECVRGTLDTLSALKSWLQLILAKYDINGNYSLYIKATSTKLAIIIVRPSVNKLQHFVAMETVT